MLPPDPTCPVARQVRLGVEAGATILIVIAEATDTIPHLAKTSLLAANSAPNSHLPSNMHGGGRGESRRADEWRKERRERRSHVADEEGILPTVEATQAIVRSSGPEHHAADACQPLTVIVEHEEGSRMLEWIRQLAVQEWEGHGGGDGSYGITARLVERDNVGRLWGDVVWALDLSNWPKSAYRRAYVCVNGRPRDCL